VCLRDRLEQVLRVRVFWIVVDHANWTDLDKIPSVHYADTVADLGNNAEVVGDEND